MQSFLIIHVILDMKSRLTNILLLGALCLFSLTSLAQKPLSDKTHATDSNRFQYHLSLGTGAYSGWGSTHAYTTIAPSFQYRLTPKVTAFGGFAVSNDINASTIRFSPSTPSYAPRKNSTRAGGATLGAIYRPNEKLTLAACAYYIGGQIDPLWNNTSWPVNLDAYGFSAAMNYRFKNNSSLSFFFDYVHDNAGTLVDPWIYYYGIGDPFFHDGFHSHHSPLSGLVPDYYLY